MSTPARAGTGRAPDASERPVLVAVSHGTRSPAGRRTIARLRLAVGALRPGVEVLAAHVDVQKPALDDVVARLSAAGRASVVVPLLLSTGYHVRSDVAGAVAASGGRSRAAAALGPHPRLVEVLLARLAEAGAGPDDAVVVAAAGSLSPRAAADVEEVLARVASHRPGGAVAVGYAAAQSPTVPQACAALRASHPGRRLVVAPYLLAPGVFSQRLERLVADGTADAVAGTLCSDAIGPGTPDAAVAALALRRYDEALEPAAQPAAQPAWHEVALAR